MIALFVNGNFSRDMMVDLKSVTRLATTEESSGASRTNLTIWARFLPETEGLTSTAYLYKIRLESGIILR